ncbi:MAG: serine/threonine-protein kinase [Myxococcota bacterium]
MPPAAARDSLDVGEVVAGRYLVQGSLGTGGMAEVYQAVDQAGGAEVALKLLRPEIANNTEAVERLKREGEVLKELNNPAIVRLETFGKLEDGRIFIAMELLRGETLGERMRREKMLDPKSLCPIVAGACAGLAAAHEQRIIHRDLKPDNLFLQDTEHGMQVKLLDFGISKVYGSERLTQTGEVLGTPRYMAPEQLAAERDIDGRTDVYAMGVLLYEAISGHPPFVATTPTDLIVAILNGKVNPLRSFVPDVLPEVEAVVARAMARAREARYATAGDLAEAYIDAASPPTPRTSHMAAREGMATAPLGSMNAAEVLPAPAPPPAAEDPKAAMRPGTFSELHDKKAPVRRPRQEMEAVPVLPEGPSLETSPERSKAGDALGTETPDAAAPQAATPQAATSQAATPQAAAPQAAAPDPAATRPQKPMRRAAPAEMSGEYRLPTKRAPRAMLIIGGVLAGAFTAGLVILVLKLLAADDSPAPIGAPPDSEQSN